MSHPSCGGLTDATEQREHRALSSTGRGHTSVPRTAAANASIIAR
jgi:hypothetical protein